MSNSIGINPFRLVLGSEQKLTAGASAVSSTAFSLATYAVMVSVTTQNVRIQVGSSPTATANSFVVKVTDPPLLIGCGAGEKLSVIQDSAAGGLLSVVELSR